MKLGEDGDRNRGLRRWIDGQMDTRVSKTLESYPVISPKHIFSNRTTSYSQIYLETGTLRFARPEERPTQMCAHPHSCGYMEGEYMEGEYMEHEWGQQVG